MSGAKWQKIYGECVKRQSNPRWHNQEVVAGADILAAMNRQSMIGWGRRYSFVALSATDEICRNLHMKPFYISHLCMKPVKTWVI